MIFVTLITPHTLADTIFHSRSTQYSFEARIGVLQGRGSKYTVFFSESLGLGYPGVVGGTGCSTRCLPQCWSCSLEMSL